MYQVLESDRIVMVDVDNTLIMWDTTGHRGQTLTIEGPKGVLTVAPHGPNIRKIIEFWKVGYVIVVWSGTGAKWAEIVVQALGLSEKVTLILSKPLYYFDDQLPERWMGRRIYINLHTGKEE